MRAHEAAETTAEVVVDEHRDAGGALRQLRRARALRRVGLVVIALLVAAGCLNLLGVRMATVSDSGGGYQLAVRYPLIARPGLGVRWQVEVERPGGFDEPVELAIDTSYFALFDENGWSPAPESETPAGDQVIWTFEPPQGDRVVITFDARMAPSWTLPREGRVAVLSGGVAVVAVDFRTWSLP